MVPPNDPNVDPDGKGNGGDPKFVTQEQLSQVVNAAVSSHVKRLETRMTATIGSAMRDVVAEQLKDVLPKPDDPPPKDPKPDDGKKDPAVAALERTVTQLTGKLEKAEGARAEEAKQRLQDALRTSVVKQLGEAGLSGPHLKGAQAALYQDGRVHVDDSGAQLFRDDDGTELPLTEGLKAWVGSDDAKLYLPPKGVSGSGDQGGDSTLPKLKDDGLNQAVSTALVGVQQRLR